MYKFFIELSKFLNEQKIIEVYYEEASKNGKFPYGVISDPVRSTLNYGTLIYFDTYIWASDQIIGVELEEKIEQLINLLDGKLFSDEYTVVYFEDQRPVDDPEYKLIKKKLTFSARKF